VTGDILRTAVREGTDLGRQAKGYMDRGELVPDEVIIGLMVERVSRTGDGFLMDGFPRTQGQAQAFDAELDRLGRPLTAALLIDVPDEELVRRLSGRRVCERSGHPYHVEFDPPRQDGICDEDGSPLIQRDDDQPETIRRRLEVYREQTEPLVAHYEERGTLQRVDGARPPGEVHEHIHAMLSTLRLEDEV
jgi:adenylate kinase